MLTRTTTTLAVLGLLAAALPAQTKTKAQGPNQEQLQTQRAEKLAKEVFKKAPWTFDYDKARAEAKQSGKLILAYFTRSYAH
jgi:hypothetical protein